MIKNRLKVFVNTKPTLQKILERIQPEEKNKHNQETKRGKNDTMTIIKEQRTKKPQTLNDSEQHIPFNSNFE